MRRINRTTYFVGLFICASIAIILLMIAAFIPENFIWVMFIPFSVWIIYLLDITLQRANDIGWHPILITVLTFWSPAMIILGLIKGHGKGNKYGVVPQVGFSKNSLTKF